MKTYPLDIHYFDGWVWSKGHHSTVLFGEAVTVDWNGCIKPETLRHRYARTVPVLGADMGLVYCDGPGRGAFPITEAEVIR